MTFYEHRFDAFVIHFKNYSDLFVFKLNLPIKLENPTNALQAVFLHFYLIYFLK